MDWQILCLREIEDFYSPDSVTGIILVTFHTGDLGGTDDLVEMFFRALDANSKDEGPEDEISSRLSGYEIDDHRSYTATGASAGWQEVIITVLDRSTDAAVGLLFAEILAWCKNRMRTDSTRATNLEEAIQLATRTIEHKFPEHNALTVTSARQTDEAFSVTLDAAGGPRYVVSISREAPHQITVRRQRPS